MTKKKKNVSKMDQVMKSPMDIAAAGIIMTKDDVIQMLKDQIESLRHEVEVCISCYHELQGAMTCMRMHTQPDLV